MNRYGPKAQEEISKTMRQFATGRLRAGRRRRPVHDRDQAVAIGISKARQKHYKVPRINKPTPRDRRKS